MFSQKPPKIKEAIADFLRGINYRTEKEILENVRHLTTSDTPERSINRTLNELYNKGILEKLYLKDDMFFTWDTLKPEDKFKRFPRFYKLISEQYRKQVSTTLYCGTNTLGNQDNNPNYLNDTTKYRGADQSPRKTPSDVKAWTFDTIKDIEVNRKEELASYLFDQLVTHQPDCFEWQVSGDRMSNTSRNDFILAVRNFMERLGYDHLQPMQNVEQYKMYPKIHWSIRGVEQ